MLLELEWGPQGIQACPQADLYVIFDVLSFSSCVDIAIGCGATILPFAYRDERAAAFAMAQQAMLASERGAPGYSLSPASLLQLQPGSRLVLPSPNGATLSLLAQSKPVLSVCLRNAAAAAAWIQAQDFELIQLVPAGERWPDGSLRPAIEDWLGAGALAARLKGDFSPEAEMAAVSYLAGLGRLPELIRTCPSGQELIQRGFGEDVELAVQADVSPAVPGFADGAYTDWREHAPF